MNLAIRMTFTAALIVGWGCGRSDPGALSVVNHKAYKAYVSAATDLTAQPPRVDSAVKAIEDLKKQDPDNAMNHYALACCYAKQGDWDRVQKALDEGNAAKRCIHYVWQGPFHPFPMYAQIRAFTNDAKSASGQLGPEKSAKLFDTVREMGTKMFTAEPRDTIAVLVGMSLRLRGDRWAETAYRRMGNSAKADEAARRFEEDTTWGKAAKARLDALAPQIGAAAEKEFTRQEIADYLNGKEPLPQDVGKLEALDRDTDKIERPVVEEVLKTVPK